MTRTLRKKHVKKIKYLQIKTLLQQITLWLTRGQLGQDLWNAPLRKTWSNSVCPSRRERPLSLGIFPPSGGVSLLTPDPQARAETLGTEGWRFTDPTQPRSNTSLKVGVWVAPPCELLSQLVESSDLLQCDFFFSSENKLISGSDYMISAW